jgi:hypothetical protein
VVDKNARQAAADRLMDQERRDRRIDPARKTAQNPALANLRVDRRNRLGPEGAHGPIGAQSRDLVDEIRQQPRAVRRVRDFEMKLHAIEAARFVGDCRQRRVLRGGNAGKSRRQVRHRVAMAHPNRIALTLFPYPFEQRALLQNLDLGAAEFAFMPGRDPATQLRRHRLLAIADAEDRHPGGKNRIWNARRAFVVDGRGTARKNHRFRRQLRERFFGVLDGRDLAIDARLADAPRDQLRHL